MTSLSQVKKEKDMRSPALLLRGSGACAKVLGMVTTDGGEEDEIQAPLPSRGLSALTDLNDLEVFARVVEKAGFSRAARELGVPASTVSRRVARLEEGLGVRLLQRTTRTMHLTDAGRIYFDRISRALREIESAETSLREVQGSPRGVVRITTVSEPFVEGILFDFLETHPEVSLEIDKSHARVDLVADGYDLAIRAGVLEESSLVAYKLMNMGPVICASPKYLKKRGTPRTIGDLRDHECVILGTSSTAATWSLKGTDGQSHRVNVSGRLAINGLASAVEGCRRGLGIGLFPESFIAPWVQSGELSVILAESAPAPNGLWIVHPSRTLLAPAVRAVMDHIKTAFKDGMLYRPEIAPPGSP